jgi:hypothetical protein
VAPLRVPQAAAMDHLPQGEVHPDPVGQEAPQEVLREVLREVLPEALPEGLAISVAPMDPVMGTRSVIKWKTESTILWTVIPNYRTTGSGGKTIGEAWVCLE